ncbi:MAG: hypothetical protein ACJ71T_16330 [Actinomycetales bacterium]
MRRLLLVLALAAGALAVPTANASAGVVDGACPTSKGVTVVVNFGSLGGGTQVSCYTGATSSTTGLTALHGAGFTTAGTIHDGPGFVCRINDEPGDPPEACNLTPPASAYWSYWQASNGGSWVYSSQGAATKHVQVGGFEGWSFGNGSAKPTSSNPSRPVEPTFKLGPAASTTSHKSSSSSTSPTSKPTATKRSPTSAATSTSSDTATALAAGPSGTAGAQLPDEGQGPGRSPWPFVLGVVAVAALLSGAYLVVLRRRGSGF